MSEEEKKLYYRLDYTKSLPDAYVGDLWMGERLPLEHLISDTKQIILGRLAGEEFLRRKGKYPEIASLMNCIIGYSPWRKQEIAHRCPGSLMPDGNKAFGDLWNYAKKAMQGRVDIESIRSAYDEDDMEQGKRISILEEVRRAGSDNYVACLELDKIVASGLNGKLGGYLNEVTIHDTQDAVKGERRRKHHEILESQKTAELEAKGAEATTPFLDTLPTPEPEETLDLKSLGLDIDKLTPKELALYENVLRGFKEGYEFWSKRGDSFREYWNKDYERNIKAWKRLKPKLNRK